MSLDMPHDAATAASTASPNDTHTNASWPPREPEERWISVVFLQGEDADAVLALIDRVGPLVAIEHLRHRDFGDETTDAALVNGYVYNAVPSGRSDRVIVDDDSGYTLTYSAPHRYVSLLRRHHDLPEGEACVSGEALPSPADNRARAVGGPRRLDTAPAVARTRSRALSL